MCFIFSQRIGFHFFLHTVHKRYYFLYQKLSKAQFEQLVNCKATFIYQGSFIEKHLHTQKTLIHVA